MLGGLRVEENVYNVRRVLIPFKHLVINETSCIIVVAVHYANSYYLHLDILTAACYTNRHSYNINVLSTMKIRLLLHVPSCNSINRDEGKTNIENRQ